MIGKLRFGKIVFLSKNCIGTIDIDLCDTICKFCKEQDRVFKRSFGSEEERLLFGFELFFGRKDRSLNIVEVRTRISLIAFEGLSTTDSEFFFFFISKRSQRVEKLLKKLAIFACQFEKIALIHYKFELDISDSTGLSKFLLIV